MDEKYKKLLGELSSIETEALSVSEIETKIKTMLGEHANIAVPKASTMPLESILEALKIDGSDNDAITMNEIEKKISELTKGGK